MSVALSFSGGKDSLACIYLMRAQLDRITVYHMDTGDLLPEIVEVVEHVKTFAPHFVHVRGDVASWIAQHGLPTDLLPHGAHQVGQAMGETRTKLVSRYDCCFLNLMQPLYRRIIADGNRVLIRGTKRVDMRRMPTFSGEQHDGMTLLYPLEDWTNEQVMDYLRAAGAPICRVYDHVTNAPECARCPAWWGEGRAAYLKQHHPSLWFDYRERLERVAAELDTPLRNLRTELHGCGLAHVG